MSANALAANTVSGDDDQKILIISHGHPDFVAGGGEIAAYNLHQALRSQQGFDSVFFARHAQPERVRGGTVLSGNGRQSEILFYSSMSDWFRFSQPEKSRIWKDFRQVLELTEPELIHFHHYLHLGLEMIREVKDFNPAIPIVMTLHEFFGICHNHGQMVRTTDQSRCETASPAACADCFPEYSPQDFYLRERFIKSYFELIDQFISPSEFLARRYIEWGLPAHKIAVIENPQDFNAHNSVQDDISSSTQSLISTKSAPVEHVADKVKLSFFGQINGFKGVDVLLEAVERLDPAIRRQLQVSLNGHGLDALRGPLRDRMDKLLECTSDCVFLAGPYQRGELAALMAETDWVVVPSKWWENSPMVIEEARQYGVPVICSNIGGMAERVQDGVTGVHFTVSRPGSLAEKITQVVTNRDYRTTLAANMRKSFQPELAIKLHTNLYSELLQDRDCSMPASLRVA